MKESLRSLDSRILFRETFNSFDDIAKNGGSFTNGTPTLSNGKMTSINQNMTAYPSVGYPSAYIYTVRLIFTPTQWRGAADNVVWGTGGAGAQGALFMDYERDLQRANFYSGTRYASWSSTPITAGTKYDMVIVKNNISVDLYLNGVKQGTTQTLADNLGNPRGVRFGNLNYPSDYIFELAEIYNGALSATEIAELYKNDLYTFPQSAKDYTFNFNCLNGYLNDSKGATITNTGASVTNDGGVNVLLPTTTSVVATNRAISSLFSNSVCTISAWCRPIGLAPTKTTPYDGQDIVIDSGGYISISRAIISGNDRIWIYLWDGAENKVGITYNNDEWVNIVLVHTGGQLYGYKNGVLVSNVAAGNIQVVSNLLYIGTKYIASPPVNFSGRIGEVNTWNRALTQTEITRLYNSQKNLYK
jgi:hypothetical protein